MLILGIESSCDETAAAVLRDRQFKGLGKLGYWLAVLVCLARLEDLIAANAAAAGAFFSEFPCVPVPYALASRLFDVWTMLLFGVIGFVLRYYRFPVAPLVLGIVDEFSRRGLRIVGPTKAAAQLDALGAAAPAAPLADSYRDAEIRRDKRHSIVHAVSGHRDDRATLLPRIDDAQLLRAPRGDDSRNEADRDGDHGCEGGEGQGGFEALHNGRCDRPTQEDRIAEVPTHEPPQPPG